METAFGFNSYPTLDRMQTFIMRKLGVCRRCILTATAGMVLSWSLSFVLNALFDSPLLMGLLGLVLLVALGFTFVWLAHLVAYYIRVLLPLSQAHKNSDVVRAELSLSAGDARQVAGEFRQGIRGLSFEATFQQEAGYLSIRDRHRADLIRLEAKDGMLETSILDGSLKASMPPLVVPEDASREEIAKAVEEHLVEVTIIGEEDNLRRLQESPDYELLPLLSKTLGVMGMTGNRIPATRALHALALGALSYRHQQPDGGNGGPDGDSSPPDVVYRIKHPYQDEIQAPSFGDFLDDGTEPCLPPFIKDIYIYEAGLDEPWMTCGTGCEDGESRSYPNRSDNCYGMCGPGCECWSLICGDCCYHEACAIHDDYCRRDDWKSRLICASGHPYWWDDDSCKPLR